MAFASSLLGPTLGRTSLRHGPCGTSVLLNDQATGFFPHSSAEREITKLFQLRDSIFATVPPKEEWPAKVKFVFSKYGDVFYADKFVVSLHFPILFDIISKSNQFNEHNNNNNNNPEIMEIEINICSPLVFLAILNIVYLRLGPERLLESYFKNHSYYHWQYLYNNLCVSHYMHDIFTVAVNYGCTLVIDYIDNVWANLRDVSGSFFSIGLLSTVPLLKIIEGTSYKLPKTTEFVIESLINYFGQSITIVKHRHIATNYIASGKQALGIRDYFKLPCSSKESFCGGACSVRHTRLQEDRRRTREAWGQNEDSNDDDVPGLEDEITGEPVEDDTDPANNTIETRYFIMPFFIELCEASEMKNTSLFMPEKFGIMDIVDEEIRNNVLVGIMLKPLETKKQKFNGTDSWKFTMCEA